MAIDCGFNAGFGVLGSDGYVKSGTHRLDGTSSEMGMSFRSMRKIVLRLAERHAPSHIGAAFPFVSHKANPINLIPIMGFYARLQEIADELEIPFHSIPESRARSAFLSPLPVPRKSEAIKRAVYEQCVARGWPATDDHASDALCVADYLLATVTKGARAADRMPLFRVARPR